MILEHLVGKHYICGRIKIMFELIYLNIAYTFLNQHQNALNNYQIDKRSHKQGQNA